MFTSKLGFGPGETGLWGGFRNTDIQGVFEKVYLKVYKLVQGGFSMQQEARLQSMVGHGNLGCGLGVLIVRLSLSWRRERVPT